MKRVFDIILSLILLSILLPIFLLIAILIICFDSWPIYFSQVRIGLKGKEFKIFKFRTMRYWKGTCDIQFDLKSGSRVTLLGRLLRRTKLDELPQLINILIGDMSFVGPRPEVPYWTDVYPEKWAVVLQVRPGLTDYASVLFRNEEILLANSPDPDFTYRHEILPRKLELGINYVKEISFLGDLKILWLTLRQILFH
jgi:hypothetical protein